MNLDTTTTEASLARFSGRQLVRVGIADMKVSANSDDVIVTYALGSCIALVLWDRHRNIGGMLHYMLPSSRGGTPKGKSPFMFADLGVPMLFEAMYAHGCERGDLILHVAGGAQVNDESGTFEIGRRNYMMLRKLLWKNKFLVAAEDVGGSAARTVRLDVATGEVLLRVGGDDRVL